MQAARIQVLVPLFVVLMSIMIAMQDGWAQKPGGEYSPSIPKAWDDAAMATLEVPLKITDLVTPAGGADVPFFGMSAPRR